MKNHNGFTIIEMLVAMSIIFMLVATIIPIDTLLKQERKTLQDRRIITLYLHDKLQHVVWSEMEDPFIGHVQTKIINQTSVDFQFRLKNEWVKGCATWENARQKQEQICLYGT